MLRKTMSYVSFLGMAFALCLYVGGVAGCSDDDGGNPSTENNCTDGIDNDEDGLTDCDDDDCINDAACQVLVEDICDDTIDNDGDGLTDCDDDDCAGDIACSVLTETECDDGLDNDDDGDTDCDDSDCIGDAACTDTEVQCDDGLDNDDDGDTDCDDSDCDGDPACTTATCMDFAYDTVPDGEQALTGTSYSGDASDWVYQAQLDWGDGAHILNVELFGDFGTITTGTTDLSAGDQANYSTCAYCVLLIQCGNTDCSQSENDVFFYPTGGDLTLDSLPATTDASDLMGSLTGVNWVEVTIDPDSYESTPVDGGMCVDLDPPTESYSIDVPVEAF